MYRIAAIVTSVNALYGLVFAVQLLRLQNLHDMSHVHVLVRALPFVVAALVHVVVYSPASLCTLALLLGAIQLGDFGIGIYLRDATRTAPSLLLALLTLACAIPLTAELGRFKRDKDGRTHS